MKLRALRQTRQAGKDPETLDERTHKKHLPGKKPRISGDEDVAANSAQKPTSEATNREVDRNPRDFIFPLTMPIDEVMFKNSMTLLQNMHQNLHLL